MLTGTGLRWLACLWGTGGKFSQPGWGLRPDSAISTCEACLDGRQPEFRLLCLRLVRPPAQQDPQLPPAHRTFNAGDRWAVWRVLATNTEFSNILLQLLLQKHQPSAPSRCQWLCLSAEPSPRRIFWHPPETWRICQPTRQLLLPGREQNWNGLWWGTILLAALARSLCFATDSLRQHISKGGDSCA